MLLDNSTEPTLKESTTQSGREIGESNFALHRRLEYLYGQP
jgi:hypothetical protein